MIHDEDAVADLLDLLHVMAGVDHRRAFAVKSLDTFENRIAALWIDGHGRLVEKDQIRLVGDAAGDIKTTQQTAGQFRRTIGTVIAQSYEIQRLVHEHATFCLVGNIQRAEIIDVLLDGQFVEHGHVLRHNADTPLQRIAGRADRLAEHAHSALIEREQRKYAVDRRGLA